MKLSKSQLAVQMYTIRDFTQTASDMAQSLARIREIGYPAVQLSAVGAMAGETPELSAEGARRMLDDYGLKCVATHRNWEALSQDTSREIDFHQTLGCDFTAIGSLPPSFAARGAAGYTEFMRESLPVVAQLKAAGIRFGYHNHAFEFERIGLGADGTARTLFDILVDEGSLDLCLELDLYWISHAGLDPARLVERAANRVPVIHVKDKEIASGEPVMAPVGEGNLDWPRLLTYCAKAGVEWYAVEQDTCRRDPFDCLQSSFRFLTGLS